MLKRCPNCHSDYESLNYNDKCPNLSCINLNNSPPVPMTNFESLWCIMSSSNLNYLPAPFLMIKDDVEDLELNITMNTNLYINSNVKNLTITSSYKIYIIGGKIETFNNQCESVEIFDCNVKTLINNIEGLIILKELFYPPTIQLNFNSYLHIINCIFVNTEPFIKGENKTIIIRNLGSVLNNNLTEIDVDFKINNRDDEDSYINLPCCRNNEMTKLIISTNKIYFRHINCCCHYLHSYCLSDKYYLDEPVLLYNLSDHKITLIQEVNDNEFIHFDHIKPGKKMEIFPVKETNGKIKWIKF